MWIVVASLVCVLFLGWAFLGFSLKRQLSYVTLLVDILLNFPLFSIILTIFVSLVEFLWLPPFYGFCGLLCYYERSTDSIIKH